MLAIEVYSGAPSTEMPDQPIMRIVIIRNLAILYARELSSHAAPN